jgi:hypothetical protein
MQQTKTRQGISKESSKSQKQLNSWPYSKVHHKHKMIVHHSLQARSVNWPGKVKLPVALLDATPDALHFRTFAAALFLFLSDKKLVIRVDKFGHAQDRPWERYRIRPCLSVMCP